MNMSKGQKTLLWVVIGLVVLFLGCGGLIWLGYTLIGGVRTNPANVAAQANEMVDFELPAGYIGHSIVSDGSIRMAVFADSSTGELNTAKPFIMIASFPYEEWIDEDDIHDLMWQRMSEILDVGMIEMKLEDTEIVRLNEQTHLMRIFEGTDAQGNIIRERISKKFLGNQDWVMIMIAGWSNNWDQTEIDAFYESIK